MARVQGKVKWFNGAKGFGFIEVKGSADIFVHHTNLNMDGYRVLNEGDEVEFDLEETNKGPQATNVDRIKEGPKKDGGKQNVRSGDGGPREK